MTTPTTRPCPRCGTPLLACREGGGTGPTGDDPLLLYDRCPACGHRVCDADGWRAVEAIKRRETA